MLLPGLTSRSTTLCYWVVMVFLKTNTGIFCVHANVLKNIISLIAQTFVKRTNIPNHFSREDECYDVVLIFTSRQIPFNMVPHLFFIAFGQPIKAIQVIIKTDIGFSVDHCSKPFFRRQLGNLYHSV